MAKLCQVMPTKSLSPVSIKSSPWRPINCAEEEAHSHRFAAGNCVPMVVWCGALHPRFSPNAGFSLKVFVGGVPWDITEEELSESFKSFGPVRLEWPLSLAERNQQFRNARGTGYVYLIFESERSVRQLLGTCSYEFSDGYHNFFYKVSSAKMRDKVVQIIPWQITNSSFVRQGSCTVIGPTKTVFVGSLHGMISAEGLAHVMEQLFGGVVAASVDIDKFKYPIGSGRVTFSNSDSYHAAIRASFIELRTQKFNKKIQIDPYLEESVCNVCGAPCGELFCREIDCFKYYCRTCWDWQHSMMPRLEWHKAIMRHHRNNPPPQPRPTTKDQGTTQDEEAIKDQETTKDQATDTKA